MSASTLDRVEIANSVRAFLDELRPAEASVRANLDYGFRFHKQSIELFSIRPSIFNKGKRIEGEFAKATFIKSWGVWKIYWMRGNGNWYPYEPATVGSLERFFELVRDDEQHCFFG